MADPEGEEGPRFGSSRREPTRNPWWRPAGTWGRATLGLGVLIAISALAITVHISQTFLDRDARFRITGSSNIQASGMAEVTRAELLPVFGEDIGRNIFFVPIALRRKQLEQIPWVQQATVMRILPDQIRVSLVERKPVAFVRHTQQIGLVDANGVLLDMPASMMAQHHYSFPVVTGIDANDPLPSRKARMAVYQHLLGELDSNGQHDSDQISEIDLTDPEDARVLMPEQGADILAHFGEDHFLERYERYKAHIAEWREQYPKLAEVDLRYDQQVVLEMTPGTGGQTTVNAGDGKTVSGELARSSEPAEPAKPAAGTPLEMPPAAHVVPKSVAPTHAAREHTEVAHTIPVHSETAHSAPAHMVPVHATPAHRTAPSHTLTANSPKAHNRVGAKTSEKAKPAANSKTAKARAEKIKREMIKQQKRAETNRAALKRSRQKAAAKSHPAASAGQSR
ncbi:MAG TPA: FtsQ-type POTRA domain-containing protein [Terracidiphilus sp.]|nr:FtsQ-type POTRA domain-containing protein [Terracidiphilus sp.]